MLTLANFSTSLAQQGNPSRFEVGLSGGVLDDFGFFYGGGGFSAKMLFPISKNKNKFTVGLTYDFFFEKINSEYLWAEDFINVTGGYRKMINTFFIEPQLGLGLYNLKQPEFETSLGLESGFHVSKFTFSFNPRLMLAGFLFGADGYLILGLKTGIRF